MRVSLLLLAALVSSSLLLARDQHRATSEPSEFEIGQRTFFDIGPPFNFYELLVVRPNQQGSAVQRILLTPAADKCFAPAKIEYASASLSDTPEMLLADMAPCAIPEKDLMRKPKDCKHCQHFSGADAAIRVRCGTQVRILPAHIFEDYWFNPAAVPPRGTSTILQLQTRLEDALGPGVTEKPLLDLPHDQESSAGPADPELLDRIGNGEYDDLFRKAPDKPSELYRAAHASPPKPTVRLTTIIPFEPEAAVMPAYPRLAEVAKIAGEVTFGAQVNQEGKLVDVVFLTGNRFLQAAVSDAIKSWEFPRDSSSQQIRASISFELNWDTH
jgi:hypothetical protein